jgi:hypothetical protein
MQGSVHGTNPRRPVGLGDGSLLRAPTNSQQELQAPAASSTTSGNVTLHRLIAAEGGSPPDPCPECTDNDGSSPLSPLFDQNTWLYRHTFRPGGAWPGQPTCFRDVVISIDRAAAARDSCRSLRLTSAISRRRAGLCRRRTWRRESVIATMLGMMAAPRPSAASEMTLPISPPSTATSGASPAWLKALSVVTRRS